MDSDSSYSLPDCKRLITLAFDPQFSHGNNLLHQFVVNNSDPNVSCSASYTNAVLLSMSDFPANAVNAPNDEGYSALHLAVLKLDLLMVKKLLSCLKNIDINTRCKGAKGNTALHLAVELDYLCITRELLNKGADVNLENSVGETVLCIASESGDLNVMKLLMSKGAKVNVRNGARSPLHYAANSGNFATVEYLVTHGANVNAEDGYVMTPLHYAAKSDNFNLAILEILVSNGAEVRAVTLFDRTPLHHAVISGNFAAVEFLISNRAYVHAKDLLGGRTPLHYAVESDNLAIVKCLVDNGAYVNAKNWFKKTPLFYAKPSNFSLVEVLVNNGAWETNCWTILYYAFKKWLCSHWKMFSILLFLLYIVLLGILY